MFVNGDPFDPSATSHFEPTPMNYQVRIATEDIELCKVDKRKRYGIESIGKIAEGEVFQFRDADYERMLSAHVEFGGHNGTKYGTSVRREKAEEVLAKSKPKPATTAKEVFMANDTPFDRCAEDILELMVESGIITLEQVDQTIKAWIVSLQSKEEA